MESDERPRQLKGCVIRVSWTPQLAIQYSRTKDKNDIYGSQREQMVSC